MNLANRITVLRIILVPVFVMAVFYHRLNIAFWVFTAAAITDALDGYVARLLDQKTELGTILDPIADKLLLGSAYISLSLVSGLPEYLKMPVYVPIIVISRDVIIVIGIVAANLLSGGIKIKPTILGKVTTFFQMATIVCLLLRFVYSSWLWNITAILTIISGLDYIRISSGRLNEKL